MAARSESVVEDYLKAIYSHTEWQPSPITSSQLATRLSLAPSTVSEMIKKLVARGLVEHVPYGAITLTGEGNTQALRMVRRHRLVETWLVRQFGYRPDEVHDEAEILEHAVSDRLLDTMDDALGRPAVDPHGDPIPTRDGAVSLPQAVRADASDAPRRAAVARLSDHEPHVLRRLAQKGLDVGVVIDVAELEPDEVSAVWLALPS